MRYLLSDWRYGTSPLLVPEEGESSPPPSAPPPPAKVITDISEEARTHTGEVLDTWREVMRDRLASPNARIAAANSLADWGWRKPANQVVIVNNNVQNNTVQMSQQDRYQYAKEILEVLVETEEAAKPRQVVEEEIDV